MSEVLIELGEVGDEPVAREPLAPRHYRALLGGVAVLLSMVLGGAVPGPRAVPPVIVAAAIGDRVQVASDRLYVIGLGDLAAQDQRRETIRAYALPDMRPLFEHPITVSGEIMDVRSAGDDLLVLDVRGYTKAVRSAIAIRPGATEPLWEQPGILVGISPDGGTAVFGSDTYGGGDPDHPVDWRGVDTATGWSGGPSASGPASRPCRTR